MAFFTETYAEITSLSNTTSAFATKSLAALGVPANAVCCILMLTSADAATASMGVRAVGSSLNRYRAIHESESGGKNGYSVHVQADASSNIEYWCSDNTVVTMYLLGYYNAAVTFTEKWDYYNITNGTTWRDITLSLAAARVHDIVLFNDDPDNYEFIGARTNGSALVRRIYIDENEGTGGGATAHSWFVKSDASGIIEGMIYGYADGSPRILDAGYFSDNVDFVEAWSQLSITSNSTWTEITAAASNEGNVASVVCCHQNTGVEKNVGAKTDNSGVRYYQEHEAEGGGVAGAHFPTLINGSNKYYVYCEDASVDYFYIAGYLSGPTEEGRTTKNTRGWPLGVNAGLGFSMNGSMGGAN